MRFVLPVVSLVEFECVVASQLLQLSDLIVKRDEVPGCDREKGVALQSLAVENLPYDFDSQPIEAASANQTQQEVGHPALLGEWAWHCSFSIHSQRPGLVQHIGQISSITPQSKALGYRRSDCFAGDEDTGVSGSHSND